MEHKARCYGTVYAIKAVFAGAAAKYCFLHGALKLFMIKFS